MWVGGDGVHLRSGFQDDAREILGKFKWGHAFFSVNEDLLDRCDVSQSSFADCHHEGFPTQPHT